MSLIYITRCDLCQTAEQEWPEGSGSIPSWTYVQVEDKRLDFCHECWAKVQKTLELIRRGEG